ncbi:MAG: hypothetical protein SchgKO_21500 [Schleiferiaceae bacterium]
MIKLKALGLAVMAFWISSCTAQPEKPDYGLHDPSEKSFSEAELNQLNALKSDWMALSDRYILSVNYRGNASYNLRLDSVGDGPMRSDGKWNELVPVNYPWIEEKGVMRLGFLPNDWRGRAINKDVVYTVFPRQVFSIFDAAGNEMFSYSAKDTLADGTVWFYDLSLVEIDFQNLKGCLVLSRNDDKLQQRDFRIYDLKGKPLTSWKEYDRAPFNYQRGWDPFLGWVESNPEDSTFRITSFAGEKVFEANGVVTRHQTTFPPFGMYRLYDMKKKKSFLVNPEGKSIEVPYGAVYRIEIQK